MDAANDAGRKRGNTLDEIKWMTENSKEWKKWVLHCSHLTGKCSVVNIVYVYRRSLR